MTKLEKTFIYPVCKKFLTYLISVHYDIDIYFG